ncbi:MAG: 50S ribosomal protein L7/L12 [Parcubacteria group bacterium GW2011_GWC2_39_14]|nr:MAG: 50S ribosomal protein L7/L12 [Parcubacteria group bacterium GW2011_GWC2_39_14]KKR55147.1 MAG: 50S ribosomal protein L7/L12 [Parcubacteria group bacterium GW2011_GWA2_40_23]
MISFFRRKKETVQTAETRTTPTDIPLTQREIIQTITRMQRELDRLKSVITNGKMDAAAEPNKVLEEALLSIQQRTDEDTQRNESEKVIEGVFDGEGMIGADGGRYDVPANYASKSKLVEGDILKLTINNMGAFVYKQIKPIERARLVGTLEQDEHSLQYSVESEGKKWKLLTASVTYFKGDVGDEVVFLIPAEGGSRSAAVENIIKR